MLLFDYLKNYINGRIAEDKELNMSIGIKEQYPYGHKPNPPEILISIVDHTEFSEGTTFEGEKVSTALVQIIPMANSMNIGGKKYSAQKSCNLLSDKICDWFEKATIKENIPKIINSRRIQWSSAFPYENGTTTYYSILRFQLTVTK